jgi:O-antigen/teichoic acid export membrane protein
VRGSVAFTLIFAFIKNENQVILAPIIESLSLLLATIFLLFFVRKVIGPFKFQIDIPFWKNMLHDSFPFAISLMMIRAHAFVGVILLGLMGDDRSVGLLRAAIMIPNLLFFMGTLYSDSLYPVISRFYASSLEKLKILISYATKLAIAAGLPISIGGFLFAPSIINTIFGADYQEAILTFRIIIWSPFIVYFGVILKNSLAACDNQKYYSFILISRATTATVLCIVLIPIYSMNGVAVALLCSELVSLGLSYLFFCRQIYQIRLLKFLPKPVIACGVMIVSIMLNRGNNFFLSVGIAGIVYLLTLFFVGGITKEEISLLKSQVIKAK